MDEKNRPQQEPLAGERLVRADKVTPEQSAAFAKARRGRGSGTLSTLSRIFGAFRRFPPDDHR
jgi:hypothetical protein